MSRTGATFTLIRIVATLFVLPMFAGPLRAQDDRAVTEEASAAPTATAERVMEDAQDAYGPAPPMDDCSDEQEAAILTGEIIVCRRQQDQSEYRTMSRDDAQARYARETMNKDNPQAPDVSGPGIFKGPPTVSGLCLVPPCPPAPAYFIDFDDLPEAPPGSDADRIARGLAPTGNEKGDVKRRPESDAQPQSGSEVLSPSGSEAPAEQP